MRDLDTKLAEAVRELISHDLDHRITGVYLWPLADGVRRPYIMVETSRASVKDARPNGDLWTMGARVTLRATNGDATDLFGAVEGAVGSSRDLAGKLDNSEINVRLCLFDLPTEQAQTPDGWEKTFAFSADCAHARNN